MSNKDLIVKKRCECGVLFLGLESEELCTACETDAIDRNVQHALRRQTKAGEVKAAQRHDDLKEFMKAALTGLCANPASWQTRSTIIADVAADLAEAALAELEERNA